MKLQPIQDTDDDAKKKSKRVARNGKYKVLNSVGLYTKQPKNCHTEHTKTQI